MGAACLYDQELWFPQGQGASEDWKPVSAMDIAAHRWELSNHFQCPRGGGSDLTDPLDKEIFAFLEVVLSGLSATSLPLPTGWTWC